VLRVPERPPLLVPPRLHLRGQVIEAKFAARATNGGVAVIVADVVPCAPRKEECFAFQQAELHRHVQWGVPFVVLRVHVTPRQRHLVPSGGVSGGWFWAEALQKHRHEFGQLVLSGNMQSRVARGLRVYVQAFESEKKEGEGEE